MYSWTSIVIISLNQKHASYELHVIKFKKARAINKKLLPLEIKLLYN